VEIETNRTYNLLGHLVEKLISLYDRLKTAREGRNREESLSKVLMKLGIQVTTLFIREGRSGRIGRRSWVRHDKGREMFEGMKRRLEAEENEKNRGGLYMLEDLPGSTNNKTDNENTRQTRGGTR